MHTQSTVDKLVSMLVGTLGTWSKGSTPGSLARYRMHARNTDTDYYSVCTYIPRGLERVQVYPVSLDPRPLVQWEEHVPDGDGAQVHHEGLGRGIGDRQNEDWGVGCHVYGQVLVPRLEREREREG